MLKKKSESELPFGGICNHKQKTTKLKVRTVKKLKLVWVWAKSKADSKKKVKVEIFEVILCKP